MCGCVCSCVLCVSNDKMRFRQSNGASEAAWTVMLGYIIYDFIRIRKYARGRTLAVRTAIEHLY